MPTWQLLGGSRKEIPAYASTVTYASVEEYLDVADQCAELGYPALKLHAFGDAREDARLCEAVREPVSYTHLDVYKRQVPHRVAEEKMGQFVRDVAVCTANLMERVVYDDSLPARQFERRRRDGVRLYFVQLLESVAVYDLVCGKHLNAQLLSDSVTRHRVRTVSYTHLDVYKRQT